MRAVHVDSTKATVRVQGGATLGDLDRETHAFGLAIPAGIVPNTGIAGLALGGGVGWLIRKYGMSIDNLLSCQVVTSEGKVLEASADENEDLLGSSWRRRELRSGDVFRIPRAPGAHCPGRPPVLRKYYIRPLSAHSSAARLVRSVDPAGAEAY